MIFHGGTRLDAKVHPFNDAGDHPGYMRRETHAERANLYIIKTINVECGLSIAQTGASLARATGPQ